MIKVLFVCVHNAARSQIAEAYLNALGKGYFQAESAGLEPGVLNPDIVKVMAEEGYDLNDNKTKSVFDFYREGRRYHVVVKVCDTINGQKCPVFPATLAVFEWNHEDPAALIGSDEERLNAARKIRDDIKANIQAFIDDNILMEIPTEVQVPVWQTLEEKGAYHLTSQLDLLRSEEVTNIGIMRDWIPNPFHAAQLEAITNQFLMDFGGSMLSQRNQATFTQTQVRGLTKSVQRAAQIDRLGELNTKAMESILHQLYESKRAHIRLISHSLRQFQTVQVLLDTLIKAIETKRLLLWFNDQDAAAIVGIESLDPIERSIQLLRNGKLESVSLQVWFRGFSDKDYLIISDRT